MMVPPPFLDVSGVRDLLPMMRRKRVTPEPALLKRMRNGPQIAASHAAYFVETQVRCRRESLRCVITGSYLND
jgi:hypothetical protein